jgi:predicted DNA-binding WGR domain protein
VTSLHILLEARSAARRCWRAYEIDVGTDLFGACLVEMSYGRIGAMGRSKVRSFATAAAAQAEVHPTQACSRAATDRARVSSAACQPVRGLVTARPRRSADLRHG